MPLNYVPLKLSESPPISTGEKKYLLTSEDISALLVADLDNRGGIECLFALAVNQEQDGKSKPIMIIAAEYNPMDSILLGDADEKTKKYYLDVYDKSGHSNYGIMEQSDDIQEFKTKAIAIMKERCGITDEVHEFNVDKLMRDSINVQKIRELASNIQQLGDVTKENKNEIQELYRMMQKLDKNGKYSEKIGRLLKQLEDI